MPRCSQGVIAVPFPGATINAFVLNEQIGQYRITERLGQGGMGEIFAARDEKLHRTVAVKFIANARVDSEASRRLFLREARAAAALDHPFICTVHDVLEHNGQPVIVMERIEGQTLQALLVRGPLPLEQIVRYGREIAEALAAAHARGIVHRDVKTSNIMLTPSGHVKVMDFGLAVVTSASPDEATAHFSEELKTRVAGTLPYMAPEVLQGEKATSAADAYGLGVVLYEMATGRQPFRGKTDAVLIAEILKQSPPQPRQINASLPRPIDELILALLSKNAAERPAMSEVIDRLTDVTKPRKQEQRSLAVLPFQSLTSDADNAHLGLGLADAVTSELALIHSLIVRPTAAILKYEKTADPVMAARELGVDAVVTGAVQRAGSRLRVTVQLISASEDRPLWSTKIDTNFDDIFALQDEVSRKIVAALQVELTPGDERRIGTRVQASGDVIELLFKGRLMLLRESVADVNAAIDFFERAREIDPRHPLPLLGLADAYTRLAFTWDPDGGWFERAREMCDRALRLDPTVPEGHYIEARLAWTPQGGFDHEFAMRQIVAALAQRPNLSEGFDWLATILFHVGLVEEASEQYDRALTINPDDVLALTHRRTIDTIRGDFTAARAVSRRIPAEYETQWSAYATVIAEIHGGDLDAAERMREAGLRKFPGSVTFHSVAAVIAALRKNEAAARKEIERTEQMRRQYGHFHHCEFDIACALAVLGDRQEALGYLTSATRNGFPCAPAVENEPLLASLRDDPQYRALIADLHQTRAHYSRTFDELRKTIWTA